jgi:cystathionine beta-lyase/cystathionine gamma-synthase
MPSNPSLSLLDIPAVSALAHTAGAPMIVDSTVATPALMRPLTLGADIVIHSTTKSMTSSGMAVGGAVVARHDITTNVGTDQMASNFAGYVKLFPYRDHGPAVSPFNALMTISDLRTLRHRMDTASTSAMRVAQFLDAHDEVDYVLYPGIPTRRGHEIAARDMWLADGADDYGAEVNRFGHLLSFTVKAGAEAARSVLDGFDMIWRATDLGRIKSVATIPCISTHQQQGETGRELAGVPANLIRLNVGGEHPADIIADLERALAAVSSGTHRVQVAGRL